MADLLADTSAARRRRKAIALTLGVIALLLLIITILWWRSLPDEDAVAVAAPGVPVEITPAALFAAYEADPTLAQFDTRPILITANLVAPPTTGTSILLGTPDPLLELGAELEPGAAVRLADMQPGTEISLRCTGASPGVRAPMLLGCTLR